MQDSSQPRSPLHEVFNKYISPTSKHDEEINYSFSSRFITKMHRQLGLALASRSNPLQSFLPAPAK